LDDAKPLNPAGYLLYKLLILNYFFIKYKRTDFIYSEYDELIGSIFIAEL